MQNVTIELKIGHRDRWGDKSMARGYFYAEINLHGAVFGATEVNGQVLWRYDWAAGQWKAHCEKHSLVTLENTKVPAAKRREALTAIRAELPEITEEVIEEMEIQESNRLQQKAMDTYDEDVLKRQERRDRELREAEAFELTDYFDS